MHEKFTQKQLLRYYYNESSTQETALISLALDTNWELLEQYKELLESITVLDRVPLCSPNPSSVKLIMEYSQKNKREELKTHA